MIYTSNYKYNDNYKHQLKWFQNNEKIIKIMNIAKLVFDQTILSLSPI
jgi:hypothetical protein